MATARLWATGRPPASVRQSKGSPEPGPGGSSGPRGDPIRTGMKLGGSSEVAAQQGSARPLEAFGESARRLDAAGFEAEHGSGFLMVTATSGNASESTSTRVLLDDSDDSGPGGRTADLSVVVYPLRPARDVAGHLVGLAAGLLFGVLARRRRRPRRFARIVGIAWLVLYVAACGVAIGFVLYT